LLIFRTRFILAVLVILLIVQQNPKENTLLSEFLESGLFTDYAEAKYSLNFLTWFTISLFLLTHLIK